MQSKQGTNSDTHTSTHDIPRQNHCTQFTNNAPLKILAGSKAHYMITIKIESRIIGGTVYTPAYDSLVDCQFEGRVYDIRNKPEVKSFPVKLKPQLSKHKLAEELFKLVSNLRENTAVAGK